MTDSTWQFKGKYIITGKIECVTGLHIGGNTEGFEIGGMDNPVVINSLDDRPYIPGSSLKGKLRHLLEWQSGLIKRDSKGSYPPYDCEDLEKSLEETDNKDMWQKAYAVGCIFGPASNKETTRERVGPTRLAVRDTFLTEDSARKLQQWLGEGIYTEAKTENAIDRVTSVANPRPIERVPVGAEFGFTFIFDVYREGDPALLQDLFSTMAMLEDSALGGGGSRGHGVIKFKGLEAEWRSLAYYKNGAAVTPKTIQSKDDIKKLVKDFKVDDWKV